MYPRICGKLLVSIYSSLSFIDEGLPLLKILALHKNSLDTEVPLTYMWVQGWGPPKRILHCLHTALMDTGNLSQAH